ncbi:MAG: 4Fe-4S double cluster binding domain-containing protein, partial [Spirochaetota bacterium]
NLNYCIAIGKKLNDRIMDSVIHGPTLEYYNHYTETNRELSELAHRISILLMEEHINSVVIEPTISALDSDNFDSKALTYRFSHKMAATRSGIGWIGKTDLLISEKFGPRVRFVSLLTNHPLELSREPINESRCGTCSLCVDACPAHAATGKSWDITVHRDEFIDIFKCRDTCIVLCLMNFHKEATICGICVSVCPVGRGG